LVPQELHPPLPSTTAESLCALPRKEVDPMPYYAPPLKLEKYARLTFLVSLAILLGTIVLILLALFN
jgi:hypothetical protein